MKIVNNFYRDFDKIFALAGIKKHGKFHDLRSTAISNWFVQGLSEYEIMRLAGHSSFETTHKFYLAIKKDYIDKARQANVGLGLKMVGWE
ncbi:MAG: tyrosine-type recombinase/integrase [Phycisphaerae bacterium]|nr:tyrosine-type recombinase/integrase [Phycisphaerae bacterium]